MEFSGYMNGKISQWNDDKGFGFITSEDNEKVFFHISSLTTKSRRPEIGDIVSFLTKTDNLNRLKAMSVAIEGLTKTSKYHRQSNVEPKTLNAFDYMLIVIIIVSLASAAYIYFKSNNIVRVIIFGLPVVISFILLARQKKPKGSSFNCFKCKKIQCYDTRTISAWNSGFTRLYCDFCHVQWLNSRPQQYESYSSNNSSGCLVVFALIIGTSFSGYSVVNWLMQTFV